MSISLYLPLCSGRMAPELLLLVALLDLIDTLAQLLAWRFQLWLSMTWWRRCLAQSFPQHNIATLISGIIFIVLFSKEKPLRWKEINTHMSLVNPLFSVFSVFFVDRSMYLPEDREIRRLLFVFLKCFQWLHTRLCQCSFIFFQTENKY